MNFILNFLGRRLNSHQEIFWIYKRFYFENIYSIHKEHTRHNALSIKSQIIIKMNFVFSFFLFYFANWKRKLKKCETEEKM